MEFHRSYPLPVRLYRGTTYVVSTRKPSDPYEPVLYDGEGFPVRWVPSDLKMKQPIGFNPARIRGSQS